MPTNFQKREKQATQRDAARGHQKMNRLMGVVNYEQRMQARVGRTDAAFNSQPQAGWKKEWKITMSGKGTGKGDASIGPDVAWTDEQDWLQGSKACFDSRGPAPVTKEAGYPKTASSSAIPRGCTRGNAAAPARKPVGLLPSLPVLPEHVSRTAFLSYVEEADAQVQQALLEPSVQTDASDLHRYTRELAQALRVLTKPASASQKTQICKAMASVWDMRSNSAPQAGPPLSLAALAGALDSLTKCFCPGEVMPTPGSAVETP